MVVVEVLDVSRRFGDVQALSHVNLAVGAGEAIGLIGHNGAGKSTLIKLMLGLIAPDQGEVKVAGAAVRGAGFRDVRRRIAYLPESVVFYDNLSGIETLEFFARLKGVARAQCAPLLERVGLAHAARRNVRDYSKGMRQRLGFAQALLGQPELLFLDEPTSGLDPGGIREFYDLLTQLRAQGVTVVLSSHNLAQIEDRVDRLALLQRGRLRATGSVATLRSTLDLQIVFVVTSRAADLALVERALGAIDDCDIRIDRGQATVRCPHGSKMTVLAALAAHADAITDLSMREPSLEDVVAGYGCD